VRSEPSDRWRKRLTRDPLSGLPGGARARLSANEHYPEVVEALARQEARDSWATGRSSPSRGTRPASLAFSDGCTSGTRIGLAGPEWRLSGSAGSIDLRGGAVR
jgi:hypothetical protein